MSYLWLLDRVAIPTALAACFIRIGNLFNSEIIGIPSSVPWAIIFVRIDSVARHPVQLYEPLSYFLVFLALIIIYRKGEEKINDGTIFGLFLVLVFTSRFFLEFFKTKQEAYSFEVWINTGQILSIPFIVAGVALILMSLIRVGKSKA